MTDKHQHVTHSEIVKYIGAEDGEDFSWGEVAFYEDFRKRYESCTACQKRVFAYNFLKKLTGNDVEEGASEKSALPSVSEWITKFLDSLRGMGELVRGSFAIEPKLVGAFRGNHAVPEDKNIITIAHGGEGNIITLNDNFDFFEFVVSKPSPVFFKMLTGSEDNTEYKLVLRRENEDESSFYTMRRTIKGELAAVTAELDIGVYCGVVIRN